MRPIHCKTVNILSTSERPRAKRGAINRISTCLLLASIVLSAFAGKSAEAGIYQFSVSGRIGADTLTGSVTYDSTRANDLETAWTSVNLVLSGSERDGAGLLIAGSFTNSLWWTIGSQPGPYFLDTDSIVSQSITNNGTTSIYTLNGENYSGYDNELQFRLTQDPTTLNGSTFGAWDNRQFVSGGQAETDNIDVGYAALTLISNSESEVPEPVSCAVLGLAVLGLGAVRRFAVRKAGIRP